MSKSSQGAALQSFFSLVIELGLMIWAAIETDGALRICLLVWITFVGLSYLWGGVRFVTEKNAKEQATKDLLRRIRGEQHD